MPVDGALMMVIGVDEAGRGPIAGPVVAAAAMLTLPQIRVLRAEGLNDSKKTSERTRERIFSRFAELGVVWAAQAATNRMIDDTDILSATLWAMRLSVEKIEARGIETGLIIVDGNVKIRGIHEDRQRTLAKADGIVPAVMAASVAAKVIRDRAMRSLHRIYPQYGFASHKGYPTAAHRAAVEMIGPSPVHRMSFGGYSKNRTGGAGLWR